MVTTEDFIRVKNDVNGNPRYVIKRKYVNKLQKV